MLKKDKKPKMRKGMTLIETTFVFVIIGIALAVAITRGLAMMKDSEIKSYVKEPMTTLTLGFSKYKGYFQSNKRYSNLTEETIKTYVRPLAYDTTNDFIYPPEAIDVKYYTGPHGPVGNTDIRAYLCMDATSMDWDADTKESAENEFANAIVSAFPGAVIDGDVVAEYADAATAEAATAAVPDNDGFICATKIN